MIKHDIARFGVMGHPIAHSQSPFIHHAFASQTGIELEYEKILVPTDGFTQAVEQFFDQGGRGLNITVPFKQDAYELAQAHLSERAALAGAVNTLWLHDDALHGCNTDGTGLVADLNRLNHPPDGKRVLILGAGGAARGAIPALLENRCKKLHIANRTSARANQLQHDFSDYASRHAVTLTSSDLATIQGEWDIVINATSSSLDAHNALDIQLDYAPSALAYDMVYGAQPTGFMVQAAQQGAHDCVDGLGMLVGQAAASFTIWHGITPKIQPVLASLRTRLNNDKANP